VLWWAWGSVQSVAQDGRSLERSLDDGAQLRNHLARGRIINVNGAIFDWLR
jgi:hypothetical protein